VDSILAEKTEIDQKLLQLASKIDEFEGYGGSHATRISSIAGKLADSFGLASRDRFFLEQAALIHDVGEMSMNRDYIRASRGLTTVERLDLQRHPVIGEQDASKLGLPRGVQLIVRWHHEWWNGGGYPDCLEGEQIPLAARIIRVADTFCSMTGTRSFRPALIDEEARKYVREWAGIEFDPWVVQNFLALDLRDLDHVAVPAGDARQDGLSLL
jgi:HD-GYP domain-containing protein (c-di-GMP phosphodiesterase class II)